MTHLPPLLRRPRTGLLITIVLAIVLGLTVGAAPSAHADVPTFPDGYPRMGASSDTTRGVPLASENSQVRPVLFPLEVGPDEVQYAYCVELEVSARFDIPVHVGSWDTFPGDNNFASSATVRQKIAWIIYHSYPHISIADLATAVGISGLTEEEAISATQAAIWTLTDDFQYTGLGSDGDQTSESAVRVQAAIDHLLGPANVGRAETISPEVAIQAPTAEGQAGQLVGPIRITASAATVPVTITGGHDLVLADGSSVDLSAVPTDTDLFLDIPVDAPAGTASLQASITGPATTGLLVSNTDPRTQTLMIARSDQATRTADATITWQAQPRIDTSATDLADGDDHLDSTGEVTVVDTVTYDGLIVGQTYRLSGELMIRDSDGTATGTGITATKDFTATEPNGEVELRFTIPAGELVGEVLVVFETLHHGKLTVATHADITDKDQTVHRPNIGTTAVDGLDGDNLLPETNKATVVDTVAYSGLEVGQSYTLEGRLVTKGADGKSVDTGIIQEATFTPTSSSGAVTLTFTIPDGKLRGTTVVVFEQLFLNATLVAAHADIDDLHQTVYRPRIGTTAVDGEDGDKYLPPTGEATVVDTVEYAGLEPGKEYTVTGTLMTRSDDGAAVDTGITASRTFTPETSTGSVELTFAIAADQLRGEAVVVFESVQRDGTEVAAHADITDQDQTVQRPALATSATDGDDGNQFLAQHGAATVVDTVSYRGLRVGESYTVVGELMERTPDGPRATGITAQVSFVAEAPDGSVELTFTIAEDELLGSVIVVFERLHVGDVEIAAHTDIDDEAQTVYRPRIDTDAYDLADGDQQLDPQGGTLRDDVAYAGLKVGQTYLLRGEVMLYNTGETTGITGETRFVAEQSAGIAQVDFTIPDTYASRTLVVFEWLELVPAPDSSDADGDTDAGSAGDDDTVNVGGFDIGDVTAVPAIDESGGGPVSGEDLGELSVVPSIGYGFGAGQFADAVDEEADGDGTDGDRTGGTADAEDGAAAKQTEPLLLATHTDLNAERQTVRVAAPPLIASIPGLADTGAGAGLAVGGGVALALLLGGVVLLTTRLRRRRS